MHRVARLATHLLADEPCATSSVVDEPVVIDEPPSNWPEWLPFPVHTQVPRFALGDREANQYLDREGCTFLTGRAEALCRHPLTAALVLWCEQTW
eukprot:COSAG02_NODE_2324_length_9133_cov_38.463361_4_plen_95_part_00